MPLRLHQVAQARDDVFGAGDVGVDEANDAAVTGSKGIAELLDKVVGGNVDLESPAGARLTTRLLKVIAG
jgi:hypothetical protein